MKARVLGFQLRVCDDFGGILDSDEVIQIIRRALKDRDMVISVAEWKDGTEDVRDEKGQRR